MCPQDAGTRLGRRRDATSESVRQADERSEGTVQRREDPPDGGTASLLGALNSRKCQYRVTVQMQPVL
ncbi:hypothetical protein CQW29_19400 [Pantoea coffeiphila]|uniref:Uncharacterized protein n=1 Tax=Pantoea coffeiphila TaxID=1465635 RepID=A0A2S9I7Y3_9GAMM|nr:hypothetical protein CQW29_19400 [Pantoea coffeiphila]